MKKGSIGEFAKHKVGRLIDWLEGKDTTNEKEVLYLLNSIGDHNAAAQLKRMYDEKKHKDSAVDAFRDQLEHLSPEEQAVLREYMQKMEKQND